MTDKRFNRKKKIKALINDPYYQPMKQREIGFGVLFICRRDEGWQSGGFLGIGWCSVISVRPHP